MKKMMVAVLIGMSVTLALPALSDDLVDKCNNCHGKNGNSEDEKVPSIAGFSPDMIKDTMEQYKEGDRPADKYKPKDGEETDMNAIAKKLSEDDVEKLAKYYSKQTFIPHAQPFDKALAKKGAKVHKKRCEKCHSENGSNADDDAAILAGQWKAYLQRQFDLIVAKERGVPKKMKKKMKKLKKGDVEALIEFYASQQ